MELIHAVQEMYRDTVQAEILRILEPEDELLLQVVHEFEEIRSRMERKISIACFFEQKPCNINAIVGRQGKKASSGHVYWTSHTERS